MPSPRAGPRASRFTLLARLWVAALVLFAIAVPTQGAAPTPMTQPAPATLLNDAQQSIDAELLGQVWLDPRANATIEEVAGPQGIARFQPLVTETIWALGPDAALWFHYRLMRTPGERQDWLVEFPMPALDQVTLFQQEGERWRAESAGDTIAVNQWPEPGRHPFFRLELPDGQPRDIFVRIRHATSANFPVHFVTLAAHNQRIQLEYLGLGLAFGALLLLIAVCFTQSWVYRDRVYAWYALYAMVTTLAVATITGVTGHLLWPGLGALGDSPKAILSYFAAAAALLFVRNLIGISARHPSTDRLIYLLGLAGLAMGVLHPAAPKLAGLAILAGYVVLATAINLAMALAAWRRGDVVGLWVFSAYVPLALAVALSLSRLFGWLPVSFGTQYAVVVAMAIEVPLLLVALSIRSRERHGAQIREQALSTQDALTGLLAPHLFRDRLRQVVARFRHDRENAAVIFIDLVNYPRIKHHFGSAVAEQSLLRSVIKLRRLLRDVDTVSRIGEARFGVILEGVASRAVITDRAARLIAAGLMPLKGLKPDVTLQFHIAGALLDERKDEADELAQALDALLGSMSPRTRRPIRFLAPPATMPAGLQDSSMLDEVPPQNGTDRPPLSVVR
ncbi:MAG TPA: 7TM diverse intracellular signaling domain-containing protein [Ramlibacter sp.]|uniref:sensor domain-containing diguanylate cyclase n=1 Tax=Ramlibacter sp. TaxID=1917967 RepID=UPI002B7718D2|nr:7TM diverse intracellular signaling domain-containing protein [Ramlibacter sp.]HVZ45531.1 7TM diverse intracellular signaling domain-containing protein [Ramlibacter sp.]